MCPPPQTRNAAAEIKRAPLPSRRRKDGLIRFAKDNTSQGGEDGILQAIYDCLGDGPRTLVDVGAWDGVKWPQGTTSSFVKAPARLLHMDE